MSSLRFGLPILLSIMLALLTSCASYIVTDSDISGDYEDASQKEVIPPKVNIKRIQQPKSKALEDFELRRDEKQLGESKRLVEPSPIESFQLDNGQSCNAPYRVKIGDTLSAIARKCGYAMKELARINDIKPPYSIYIGQILELIVDSDTRVVLYDDAKKPVVYNNRELHKKPKTKPKKKTKPKPVPIPKEIARKITVEGPVDWDKVKQKQQSAPKPQAPKKAVQPDWHWPSLLFSKFVYKRTTPNGKYGLEIFGNQGDPIYAGSKGSVKYIGENPSDYGKIIFIQHRGNVMTTYSHLQHVYVQVGQTVLKGDLIATMGSSGNTEFPKLYFEIRKNGEVAEVKKYLYR